VTNVCRTFERSPEGTAADGNGEVQVEVEVEGSTERAAVAVRHPTTSWQRSNASNHRAGAAVD
jgi:hypothetical protein